MDLQEFKVVALAGGVGGAKLAFGLSKALLPGNLTVVVNTGDDFDHFGLRICPDLDTVCYALAGINNPETGWGLVNESYKVLDSLQFLGAPTWFKLGDIDLATHLERTRLLNLGMSLSEVTRTFLNQWGILQRVIPMSNDQVQTIVLTKDGQELAFQEYFVRLTCEPEVIGFRFEGIEKALPAPGILEKIQYADLVIFCPSNPWVSIDPILGIPGIKEAVASRVVVAVSPIISGRALKGPAAKMFVELGIEASALSVIRHYKDLVRGFIFDLEDTSLHESIHQENVLPYATQTIMRLPEDKIRLADEVLEFGKRILTGEVGR